jgi:hypothetical protein
VTYVYKKNSGIGGARERFVFSSSATEFPGEYVSLGLVVAFSPSKIDTFNILWDVNVNKTSSTSSFLLASLYEPITQKSAVLNVVKYQ